MNQSVNNIVVGMPATYHIGSDSYGGTIVDIKRNGRTLVFQLTYQRVAEEFTLRKSGTFYAKGSNCGYLTLGVAEDYRDPSF